MSALKRRGGILVKLIFELVDLKSHPDAPEAKPTILQRHS